MLIRAVHLLPELDEFESRQRPFEVYLDVEADVEYEIENYALCPHCSSPAVYIDPVACTVECDIDGGIDHDTTCPKAALRMLRIEAWEQRVAAGLEEVNDM